MRHFKNHLDLLINLEYVAYKNIIESNDISDISTLTERPTRGRHEAKCII